MPCSALSGLEEKHKYLFAYFKVCLKYMFCVVLENLLKSCLLGKTVNVYCVLIMNFGLVTWLRFTVFQTNSMKSFKL